jgi:malate dehydrogenase (oxaloacetate-decarboxylating)(NADP+)
VGEACEKFGLNWRHAEGMFFSTVRLSWTPAPSSGDDRSHARMRALQGDKGHMRAMLDNWPVDAPHIIVVTDGSRILGLGYGLRRMRACLQRASQHRADTRPCARVCG